VKLIWTQPDNNGSPITSYLVQRDVGSGVFFKVYEGVSPQFTDTGLEAGQNYNYKVRANNVVGSGQFSEVLTAIAGSIPLKITTQKILLQSLTSLTIGWTALTSEQSGGLSV